MIVKEPPVLEYVRDAPRRSISPKEKGILKETSLMMRLATQCVAD